MTRDVYLQPDAPDPVLAPETVLALVRRHVPAAQAVRGVDESGGEARTYAVDGAVILKTQRPHRLRPRTSLEKEALILRHLAARAADDPLPVPRVYGYGKEITAQGPVEYLCLSRVPGVAAQGATFAPAQRAAVLQALGAVLARVHAVPQGPLLASGLVPGDRSAADLAARMDSTLQTLTDALERQAQAGATWPGRHPLSVVADAVRRGLPQHGALLLVTLHSNPGPMHTFVDPNRLAFTGLIDFGDAYVSHPAFDLVRWAGAGDRQALLAGYRAVCPEGVDQSFEAMWRVAAILATLQSAARSPARAAECAAQIDRLMERL